MTSNISEVDGIGPVTALKFQDEFGLYSLNTVSRLAKNNPARLTDIPNIGQERADALREGMIAVGVYVPQPGDVIDDETTEATIRSVAALADETFPEEFAAVLKEQLQPKDMAALTEGTAGAVVPEDSTPILVSAAENAIQQTDFELQVPEDLSEPYTDEEFHSIVKVNIGAILGDEHGERITAFVQDLLMPKFEEGLSPDRHGVEQCLRQLSTGYLYSLENELEPQTVS